MTQVGVAKRVLDACNMPRAGLQHAYDVGRACRLIAGRWYGGGLLDEVVAAGLLHDYIEDGCGTADNLLDAGVSHGVIEIVEALNFASKDGTYREKVLALDYWPSMVKYADSKINLERPHQMGDLEVRYRWVLRSISAKLDLGKLPEPDPRYWHQYDKEGRRVVRVRPCGGSVVSLGGYTLRHP